VFSRTAFTFAADISQPAVLYGQSTRSEQWRKRHPRLSDR
jgi:hypothetical protein